MKLHRTITAIGAGIFVFIAGLFQVAAQSSNSIASAPVFVPDYSHAGEPLPDNVIDWDDILKQVDATDGDDYAHFSFSFTNVAKTAVITLATNVVNGTRARVALDLERSGSTLSVTAPMPVTTRSISLLK